MIFVDSSALVAMIATEEDGERLAAVLSEYPESITSSLAVFETVLALCRKKDGTPADVAMLVAEFMQRGGIRSFDMASDLYVGALNAHAQYGKGTGHPARLNLGDCFSYAMAKRAGVPLLYKGDDFVHTDLA